MIIWLQEQREAERRAQADADKLIILKGGQALEEARRRLRAALVGGRPENDDRNAVHWRRVARIIEKASP